jgi:hypothetical protein
MDSPSSSRTAPTPRHLGERRRNRKALRGALRENMLERVRDASRRLAKATSGPARAR